MVSPGDRAFSSFFRHFKCVHIDIVSASLTMDFLITGNELLDLSFQLIKNEVDGGIHIFRDFAGGNVDAVTGKLNFHALAELIDRHIHLRIKSGILAEESSQLLHTAAGILTQMFRRLEILESKGNVHEASFG